MTARRGHGVPASLLGLVVALTVAAGVSLVAARPAEAAATPCRAIADRGPQNGRATSPPPPAPVLFPRDFPTPNDCEWGFPIGGFGGERRGVPIKHDPVIFVHGNHSDAVDWFGVADQFKAAGYRDQELWAISYGGLGAQYAGAPIVCACPPSPRALEYMTRPDVAPYIAEGGPYSSNDVNVPDLYAFINAVLAYTRAEQVQLVGHSLGVTVIRKAMYAHRELFSKVSAAVSIAGGNHGTSLCRGFETTLYSCDEVAPNTPWLNQLNSIGEAPGPTRWMSIYNGSNNLDPFFLQTATYDDRQSPRQAGAINLTYADAWHSDLRVRPDIVATYLAFLQKHGAATGKRAVAAGVKPRTNESSARPGRPSPADRRQLAATGLPGAPLAGALLLLSLAGFMRRRSA